MSLSGYRLAGNAKTASPDFIPSLIGIDAKQISPAGSDTYFEQIDVPTNLDRVTAIAISRWVTYDNSPSSDRDPILAVKAGTLGFYIPRSELLDMAEETGAADILRMIKVLNHGR